MSKIIARRDGFEEEFTQEVWSYMPKDKYGWIPINGAKAANEVKVPAEVTAAIEAAKSVVIPEATAAAETVYSPKKK